MHDLVEDSQDRDEGASIEVPENDPERGEADLEANRGALRGNLEHRTGKFEIAKTTEKRRIYGTSRRYQFGLYANVGRLLSFQFRLLSILLGNKLHLVVASCGRFCKGGGMNFSRRAYAEAGRHGVPLLEKGMENAEYPALFSFLRAYRPGNSSRPSSPAEFF